MRKNCGVIALDELAGTDLRKSCGVRSYDIMAGQLNGRTNDLSMATLVRMAEDNGFALFPMLVPTVLLSEIPQPYILHRNHHFRAIINDDTVNLEEIEEDAVYVLAPVAEIAFLIDEKEARGVKGAGFSLSGAVKGGTSGFVASGGNPYVAAGSAIVGGFSGGDDEAGGGGFSIPGLGNLQDRAELFGPAGKLALGEIESVLGSPFGVRAKQMLKGLIPTISKQFEETRFDTRQRLLAAGGVPTGDIARELREIDQDEDRAILLAQSEFLKVENQTRIAMAQLGASMDANQFNALMGVTGLSAEQAALNYGAEQSDVSSFRDMIGQALELAVMKGTTSPTSKAGASARARTQATATSARA